MSGINPKKKSLYRCSDGVRYVGGVKLDISGFHEERENLCFDAKAKVTSGSPARTKVPTQDTGAE